MTPGIKNIKNETWENKGKNGMGRPAILLVNRIFPRQY